MNLKLLAISIGNSRTRLGAFEDGNLTESVTHPNDPVDPISRSIIQLGKPMMDEAPAVLSSVNPPLTARVSRIVHEQLGARLLRIDEVLAGLHCLGHPHEHSFDEGPHSLAVEPYSSPF